MRVNDRRHFLEIRHKWAETEHVAVCGGGVMATETHLRCDNCGLTFAASDPRRDSPSIQRLQARRAGWLFISGRDFCPTCVKHASETLLRNA
jgi:hypothetical protein